MQQLKRQGATRITLCVNHQADILRAFFRDGSQWGIPIDYSLETTALGTIGPLTLIEDLPEHFLVMNGDVLCDLDFYRLYEEHVNADRLFTICAFRRVQDVDFGVLETNDANELTGFREKPKLPLSVSTGIYVISRRLLDSIPKGKPYGFDELMHDLIQKGEKVSVYHHDGYWMDIGRPDDYEQASEDWVNGRFTQ